MTDKPSDKKELPQPDPKRPHATLDLKATEMKAAAEKDAAAASRSPSQPAANGQPAGSPKPEPHKPNDPAAAIPRQPSALTRLVTHLAAGVLGGSVVLFGGERLAQIIGMPTPGVQIDTIAADLDKRLAILEASPKSDAYEVLKSAEERLAKIDNFASQIDGVRADQTKLAEKTEVLSTSVGGAQGLSALNTRLAALEDQLKTLSAAATSETGGSRIADIAVVTSRIAATESRFSSEVSNIRDGLARDIDQRLAIREDSSKADLARLTQSLEKLKADQARLDKSVQAAQEEAGTVASAVGELKSTVDQQAKTYAKTADVAAAVTPVTGLISKLEGSLDGVLKKEQERQSNTERIVTALELGNLKRAIDSGQGFANEFDAVSASSGGRLDLRPLEPFKTSGVPSPAELKQEGRPVLLAALDAGTSNPDASVWDRLLTSAKSVVSVRKIDAVDGDESFEAVIARIEKALTEGRLGEVLAQAKKLPPEAAAKIDPWLQKVDARHSVDEAIATVENELKATLTAPAAAVPADSKE